MSRSTVKFNNETSKTFVSNQKRGSNYIGTIQNNTDQEIDIFATNQHIQGENPIFDDPNIGPIAPDEITIILEPYNGFRFDSLSPANGTIDIVEAG